MIRPSLVHDDGSHIGGDSDVSEEGQEEQQPYALARDRARRETRPPTRTKSVWLWPKITKRTNIGGPRSLACSIIRFLRKVAVLRYVTIEAFFRL